MEKTQPKLGFVQYVAKRILTPIYYRFWVLGKLIRYREDQFSHVEIETNSVCNFRCEYCPVRNNPRQKGEMSTETFRKVIDELKDIRYCGTIAPHFYNEPLLELRLKEFVMYIRKQLPRCKINIFTNGSKLDTAIFREMIGLGVDKFVIAQHTKDMLPNIKRLYSEISDAEKRKIEYSNLTAENSVLNNRGGLVQDRNFKGFFYCFYPTDFLTIDYKGDVVLCCNDYEGKYSFGNVNKEKVMDIWRKPNFRKHRKDIRNGIFNFPMCRVCSKTQLPK